MCREAAPPKMKMLQKLDLNILTSNLQNLVLFPPVNLIEEIVTSADKNDILSERLVQHSKI